MLFRSFQIAPNGQGIVATIGSGASGNVMIQNLAGVDSMAGFIYLFPPAIGSFSPTTAAKGTVVTIKGKFPLSVQSVSFGGTDASSFTVVDSLTITAVVGTGSSGSIVVKTAAGESSLGGFTFSTVTGINDPAAANVKDLTVTPNPAHDRILIRYPASLKASSLRIVDLTGHTVKVIIPPRNSTRTEVQMEDLRAGPYIVIWTDGMKRYSRVLEVY